MAHDKAAVNQHNIINEIAKNRGMKVDEVNRIYEDLTDGILRHLWEGTDVVLTHFAKFELVDREPRVGRNPYSGESVDVPARRVVKVRNRLDLNDINAPLDENGKPVREDEEHPRVVQHRERNAEREERRELLRREREERKKLAEARRASRQAERERERARQRYEEARRARESKVTGTEGEFDEAGADNAEFHADDE